MSTETAQMMGFLFEEGCFPMKNSKKSRHFNHPASVWMRQSRENVLWSIEHGLEICNAYTQSYKKDHGAKKSILFTRDRINELSLPSIGLTPFARCFSGFAEQLKSELNTIEAYRKFYILDKYDIALWPSTSEIPDFWPEKTNKFVSKHFRDGNYKKRK